MVKTQAGRSPVRLAGWGAIALIWGLSALVDRLWFALDHTLPAWDQAEYLTSALTYQAALRSLDWTDAASWTAFWHLSPKVPPLTAIATVPFVALGGPSADAATRVNLVWSAIALVSTVCLGRDLFGRRVGLWAGVIVALLPGLARVRLDYLTDYPLVATVALLAWLLTRWWLATAATQRSPWGGTGWAIAWGIVLGLGLLVKQPVIFFVTTPIAVVLGRSLVRVVGHSVHGGWCPRRWLAAGIRRDWGRLGQGAIALGLATAIAYPWYRANWITVLSGGKRATIDSAIAEGDPALNTLAAWTYYLKQLPEQVGWPLLIAAIGGAALGIWGMGRSRRSARLDTLHSTALDTLHPTALDTLAPTALDTLNPTPTDPNSPNFPTLGTEGRSLRWLLLGWGGAYLLCSLLINKDSRYALPYLPYLAVLLAWGVTRWPRCWPGHGPKRWGRAIAQAAAGLTAIALLGIQFLPADPTGSPWHRWSQTLLPGPLITANRQEPPPVEAAIATIAATDPHLQTTLGVLPSTPELNQHNFNFFGAGRNFQIYGRQVGTNPNHVPQDARSLPWFVTKTGDQGSLRTDSRQQAQADLVGRVMGTVPTAPGDRFVAVQRWPLADGDTLTLHRRQEPVIQVQATPAQAGQPVAIAALTLPAAVPPGAACPLTYHWTGDWAQLRTGIVQLTWEWVAPLSFATPTPASPQRTQWIDDRAIAAGLLFGEDLTGATVTEHTATLPPPNLRPGQYRLTATYLDAATGDRHPIATPPTPLTLDPAAPPVPAPELSLPTQLRLLALRLPQGIPALEQVFDQIARINQYDPVQAYTDHVEIALGDRLQATPDRPAWWYTVGLANVLQQDAAGAIAAFEQVTRLEPENPWAWGYLAFVYLYDFRAAAARPAADQAVDLAPKVPELRGLRAIAALLQGDLRQVWQDWQVLRPLF